MYKSCLLNRKKKKKLNAEKAKEKKTNGCHTRKRGTAAGSTGYYGNAVKEPRLQTGSCWTRYPLEEGQESEPNKGNVC